MKPKNINEFLEPLFIELRKLQSGGLQVNCSDRSFRLKVHLMLTSGDIIGVQELINHSHRAKFGCRLCPIESVSELSPEGAGLGNYFTGNRDTLDQLRDKIQFENGAPVRMFNSKYQSVSIVITY